MEWIFELGMNAPFSSPPNIRNAESSESNIMQVKLSLTLTLICSSRHPSEWR